MKKIISFLLLLAILASMIVSCNNSNDRDDDEKNGPDSPSTSGPSNPGENNPGSNSNPGSTKLAEVYEKHPNLIEIGEFHNGLAPFKIQTSNRPVTYACGYIDIQGNVIIEPIYTSSALFEYNYISVTYNKKIPISGSAYRNEQVQLLLDKNGAVQFETGKNNVTNIGTVTNGYFWVESFTEEFTGDVYTVTYYSAKDLSKITSFSGYKAYYDSNIQDNGDASVAVANSRSQILDFNIGDYDSTFKAKTSDWSIDVENLEAFDGVNVYYCVSEKEGNTEQIATVILENSSDKYYFAIVGSKGNLLMQPQKEISFGIDADGSYSGSPYNLIQDFKFKKDLCPAMDTQSGLWGYIDPHGNWKIQPQYASARSFTNDGYATVNSNAIIDTAGKIVLSAQMLTVDDICGVYQYGDMTLTLQKDGTIKMQDETYTSIGKFKLTGNLVVSNMNNGVVTGLNPDSYNQDGTYSIKKNGDSLIINGRTWTKMQMD